MKPTIPKPSKMSGFITKFMPIRDKDSHCGRDDRTSYDDSYAMFLAMAHMDTYGYIWLNGCYPKIIDVLIKNDN